ncbi:hypothetical protein RB195_002666 [Necator americanus]|uniref:Beta-lactamase-related domain-containing protein n=1 Tax=Necator americanus TaxID=51031 RepID=A0ABR1DKJ7_NECAM
MWYKSARPLAVLTSVLSYGVANKAAIYADHDSTEQNLETFTSLEAKKKKARQLIERQMVVAGIPGLSVGVTVNGHVVWREGFGFANLESGSRCTEDTVMRIASISKPITAAIAARLIQDGKLDLEKPIQDYLPDFPEKKYEGKPVTISLRQLLSHTAGIRHYKKETKVYNHNAEYLMRELLNLYNYTLLSSTQGKTTASQLKILVHVHFVNK